MPYPSDRERDRPWVMRTYAGHSSASTSNALYRRNLAKGQTGLSVAFDLPTQTGYDPDHELARGEVGKVGVPISHIGDMRALFDGIPMAQANTSMTINATAMWLLALYASVADEHGADPAQLSGTTQNDIIKEYLSRGTYVFPPAPSLRLITDMIAYTVDEHAEVEPDQRLQLPPAGGGRDAGAGGRLRAVHGDRRPRLGARLAVRSRRRTFGEVVARISFFVNAGVRFVEEMCKLRAFGRLWDEITARALRRAERQAAPVPLRRAGQLARADRGAAGEQRLPHPARDARGDDVRRTRARARCSCRRGTRRWACRGPWDQQWSLRMQQVLAFESDLLEYDDLFEGSRRRRGQGRRDQAPARARRSTACSSMGGAVAAVEIGLPEVGARRRRSPLRRRRMESGEDVVVGVNKYTETEPNPLQGAEDGGIMTVDPAVEEAAKRGARATGGPAATPPRSTRR